MFNQAVADSEGEVDEYTEGLIPGLNDELVGLKDDAATSIFDTRDAETDSSLSEIVKAKQALLEEINTEQGEILGYMKQKFFDVYMVILLELNALVCEV